MLPVSRVIGHREWAPGRKIDPRYDMNWRRTGVATVRPRFSRYSEDSVAIVQLPATPAPADQSTPRDTWPQREEVVSVGFVKGWHGRIIVRVNPGPGGGFLRRLHADTPRGAAAPPYVQQLIDEGVGLVIDPPHLARSEYAFEPTIGGPTALMITYAAPTGLSVHVEAER